MFCMFCLIALSLSAQTNISYTATKQIIANPERGLQKYSITASNYSTTIGANNLSVATLNSWRNSADKVSVVFRYFLLEDFLNTDINATYLANMQGDFDNIRNAGFKVIVRFSYSDQQGSGSQQATKAQILRHITQLTPLLNTNQDVIFSHQAGFIGTWGEWYYTNSDEFGTAGIISNTQWTNRKEILDAMLAATPVGISLQVRYAGIKTRLYGSSQLNPQTAYQNTANARIGFYNDAFLNNWGDQGTYSVNSECQDPVGNSAYNFITNETQYLPMTGETNGLNPCNNGFRTTGDNAVYEMALSNWTTLNRDYHPDFWSQIIASNHYDEILQKLGYRFVLHTSTVTVNGLDFDLVLNIRNEGFARIFKERDVYLLMKNTQDNSISTHLLDTDIRTWENSLSISQNISPDLEGTFQLYLWMPDKEATLANDPDYSIRLANENTWEASTGYNDLLQTISLSCSPTTATDTHTECQAFTWIDGNTYTQSNNTATFNLTGANGCDSIVTLDLTLLNPTTTTDTRTECQAFTWIDGNTYTQSNNTATFTLTGANGCDSIVTLDLTMNDVSDVSTMVSDSTITANTINASYQWLDCADGFSVINGASGRTFRPSSNGDYAVEIIENGCRDTSACVSIVVTDLIESTAEGFIQIFPNPTRDQIFIKNPKGIRGIVEIFDASGKVFIKALFIDSLSTFRIDQLDQGVFFVRITSGRQSISQKIIKL